MNSQPYQFPTPSEPDPWVPLGDIARLLGVNPRTVSRYRTEGRFLEGMSYQLPTGKWRYHFMRIKDWLNL